MGDVVNLRQFRKAKARKDAEASADANRLSFGRTKAERTETAKRLDQQQRNLDGHKLEGPEPKLDE